MLVVLFVISMVTFALSHAVPGGPFDREHALPAEIVANLNRYYGLDQPLWKQYTDYMGLTRNPSGKFAGVLQGQFGPSYSSRSRTVNDIFRDHLPISATLGLAALAVAVGLGVPLGVVAALKQNSLWDYISMAVAIFGVSVPSVLDVYPETFVVTSFSKDLSLPGERIGYAAVHPEMAEKPLVQAGMVLCNRILGYVNAPALMQRAVARLLYESVDISVYQRKRDRLCDALSSFGYDIRKPEGAFYLFPRTPIPDDIAFVSALQEENILTVPGTGFGGPGHFRIAYCVSDDVIEGALPGFERVIRRYTPPTES